MRDISNLLSGLARNYRLNLVEHDMGDKRKLIMTDGFGFRTFVYTRNKDLRSVIAGLVNEYIYYKTEKGFK